MTEQCLEVKELDCGGKEQSWWPSFMARLEGVAAPRHATPAPDIDKVLAAFDVPAKSARLFLQGKGFDRTRRHIGLVNTWFYVYHFSDTDGRKGEAAYVKLT